jgi:DNA polymerase I
MPSSPTSETAPLQRLLIVDGHAYAYRAFYAIRSLTSPSGAPVNAIFGFVRMLGKVLARAKPTHALVVWDGGLAAERMTLLPEYKAQRAAMPVDLERQLDEIVAYLRAANIGSLVQDSCEADDCIAALAGRAVGAGWEVVVASSDKDFMQLVSSGVRLLNPNDKSETLWGAEEVWAKAGVKPTQIVDWLSLVGDAVDNIPGVPGVGTKTAADLLGQFGSIDEMYRRLAEIRSDRLRTAMTASAELVRRNQQLIRLNSEVPCGVSLEELLIKPGNNEALRQLFTRWGFKTLLHELEGAQIESGALFEERAGVV